MTDRAAPPKSDPSDSSFYGLLLIDKAPDQTSFGVIAALRRLLGLRRIGHIGTLDPFATGLLPVCIGRATGAVAQMEGFDKRYLLTVGLGQATDSGDTEGDITAEDGCDEAKRDRLLADDAAELRAAAQSLTDVTSQVPPMHSAVKIGGRRLYQLARQGKTIERPARPIRIYSSDFAGLEPGAFWPLVRLDVRCSKGTYLREIARTYGERLGLSAHAAALRRTEVGPFRIDAAIGLDALEALGTDAPSRRKRLGEDGYLLGLETAFPDAPRVELDAASLRHVAHGRMPDSFTVGGRRVANDASLGSLCGSGAPWCFLYNDQVIALAAFDDEAGRLKLKRVFVSHEDL